MIRSTSIKRTVLFLAAFLVLGIGLVISNSFIASAEEGSESSENMLSPEKLEEIKKKKAERQAERDKKMAERKAELEAEQAEREKKLEENKQKFEEKRLEACEKKEERINEAMKKIAERRAKQVEVFIKISERTMDFYEQKGLTLDNYDALVEDVNTKRATVEAEIENLKESTVDFQCESDNPLKVSDGFKAAREGVVTAMKEYKTSVKNLIVGVKSVSSTTTNDDSSTDDNSTDDNSTGGQQ